MILVTGSTGFLGKFLVEELLAQNHKVVAASRGVSLLSKGSKHVQISEIGSHTQWDVALNDVKYVIHTAALVHVDSSHYLNPIDRYREVNVNGTLNLARQAAARGIKRFIFISSVKVNGESTLIGVPFSERSVSTPFDSYAISKYEAELRLKELGEQTGMEITIIRSPLIYGPGVKANFLMMMKVLNNSIPLPFKGIGNKRSLVALKNIASLIIHALEHPLAANQLFFVSDNEDVSTPALLVKLGEFLGAPARLFYFPQKLLRLVMLILGHKNTVNRLCDSLQVDITKTKDLLGWSPPVSLDMALKETAEYFLNKLKH